MIVLSRRDGGVNGKTLDGNRAERNFGYWLDDKWMLSKDKAEEEEGKWKKENQSDKWTREGTWKEEEKKEK